jgi:hypothetical protein
MSRYFILQVFLLSALHSLGSVDPPPQPKPLDSAEAAKQGSSLVAQLLEQRLGTNFVQHGFLNIRDGSGKRSKVPIEFSTGTESSGWESIYQITSESKPVTNGSLIIYHKIGKGNSYELYRDGELKGRIETLHGNQTMSPFAESDFWIADLGLEFFYWPEQKLLKSELRKSRLCRVLESINPQPAPGAYSRVVSWIDDESLGIIHAEAYDFQNKLLKEFDAKKIKKVKGEWQLEEMEISNVQTGSRTQIEFNFDAKQFNEKSSGE